jgi:hypothetical protein
MKNTNLAPIVLFAYNRYETLVKVINSLKLNKLSKKTKLYIFSDGYKNSSDKIKILKVRSYLKSINGFKKIIIYERKRNLGLSSNIINGVTKILSKHYKAIIIEDDILISKFFLQYMNRALNIYKNDKNVASIHGYQYPISFPKNFPDTFFLKGADCWGWGTWKRAWTVFDKNALNLYSKIKSDKQLSAEFNYGNSYNFLKMLKNHSKGKINSWAIRWYASAFLNKMYTLYPKKTYVCNLGFDNDSTHTNNFFYYNSKVVNYYIKLKKVEIKENTLFRNKLEFFFKKRKWVRFFNFIKYKIF